MDEQAERQKQAARREKARLHLGQRVGEERAEKIAQWASAGLSRPLADDAESEATPSLGAKTPRGRWGAMALLALRFAAGMGAAKIGVKSGKQWADQAAASIVAMEEERQGGRVGRALASGSANQINELFGATCATPIFGWEEDALRLASHPLFDPRVAAYPSWVKKNPFAAAPKRSVKISGLEALAIGLSSPSAEVDGPRASLLVDIVASWFERDELRASMEGQETPLARERAGEAPLAEIAGDGAPTRPAKGRRL